MEILEEKSIQELANNIYENIKDMDYMDYEESKEATVAELENVLYQLKAIAQNDYNQDYWRTFWNALQLLNL